jgi:hypothetical protein
MFRGAERDGRAVGVAGHVRRLVERVHDRRHVLELALEGVAVRVAALPPPPAVDGVEREALDERREDVPEAPVGARRPVEEHERRPLTAAVEADARAVARRDVLDDGGRLTHGGRLPRIPD